MFLCRLHPLTSDHPPQLSSAQDTMEYNLLKIFPKLTSPLEQQENISTKLFQCWITAGELSVVQVKAEKSCQICN